MNKFAILSAAACFCIPALAHAATDGTLGTSSTGEIGVSVKLTPQPAQISITGLKDVNFDKTIGDSLSADQTLEACVFMDEGGTYAVEVDAEPLSSGGQHYPYDLSIDQNVTGSEKIELSITNTSEEGSASGFNSSNVEGCNGGDARLMIKFEDVGNPAITGTFSAAATVTLVVVPD